MKLSTQSAVPVYTVSGASTARPLPEWLIRKRKRSLKQDPEFANRIELLQDFEFEEASTCVRASEDGNWLMSTGTYKPQIHTHYLPHLSLSFARHTDSLNKTFILLSSDYSKSLHLQTDRSLQFQTPSGCHYTTRIPRYGRDLAYDKRSAEALIPSVGLNGDGYGEVFRLNLEVGRFMKGYDIDVGSDESAVERTALQGGVDAGSVNTAVIAEESHNLLAFGTSLGTVEFWDSRSRSRVAVLPRPRGTGMPDEKAEITALDFHHSGLSLATGSSTGLIYLYDLRSPVPLLKKDQGYGYPIQTLKFLNPTTKTKAATAEPKVLSSDKRIIKLWDPQNGQPWTSVEPAVDLNHVTWVPDSGMLLTANEGRQQHSFFIPQLGPAPRWCAFLDNLVEEMAEDGDDPNAFNSRRSGEIYDNYKFLTMEQLRALNLDHLVGTTSLLRPYMHGYFVAQRLYEEARLISNPNLWEEKRAQNIQQKIEKERESRIRGNKKVSAKVNRKLAEKLMAREEAHERRRARRIIEKGGGEGEDAEASIAADGTDAAIAAANGESNPENEEKKPERSNLLTDTRFAQLFQDEDFAVDETSREFQLLNPSTKVDPNDAGLRPARRLTAAEEEELSERGASSGNDHASSSDSESEAERKKAVAAKKARARDDRDAGRISSASYKKAGHRSQQQRPRAPQMVVSSSNVRSARPVRDASFGAQAAGLGSGGGKKGAAKSRKVVGEKEVTFAPQKKERMGAPQEDRESSGRKVGRKDRRSASGNVFRKM
ncbi:WD40 repeat-like protein [Viridothelium virens]|uniref:WD40 repeat-like protein n=1 Tax=Viridothelium virens TaxID=1048519 RepID=A0A6A6HPJ6_VIRVR|nr:WD40 repeat-like protein [Viridothelium virens]